LDPQVLHQYRARFADDPSRTNLRNWARFEVDNPDTFIGMYKSGYKNPSVTEIVGLRRLQTMPIKRIRPSQVEAFERG